MAECVDHREQVASLTNDFESKSLELQSIPNLLTEVLRLQKVAVRDSKSD